MTVAGRIGIGYLNTIHGFVGGLQSEAESILRLLDSDDEEADVRAKMAALKKRFRELRWEANRCSSAARSAEETVLLVINANLDRSSGASAAPPANASQTSYFHDDDVRDSQDLPEFVSDYLGSSFQDGDVFPVLEDFLNGANFDLSFDQGARRVLATFGEFLAQVMMRLGYAYINQLGVQFGQDQHDKILDKRLKRNSRWKKSSAVLLLCGAAICAAVAAVTANVKPKRLPVAAAATAASALFIGVAREIHLVLKRREKAMRNHRHIITAMMMAGRIRIRCLSTIKQLVGDLQSKASSIVKMVDDNDEEAEVRAKTVALEQSFRELQMEANRCSSTVISAGEPVLQSIITNLDQRC